MEGLTTILRKQAGRIIMPEVCQGVVFENVEFLNYDTAIVTDTAKAAAEAHQSADGNYQKAEES